MQIKHQQPGGAYLEKKFIILDPHPDLADVAVILPEISFYPSQIGQLRDYRFIFNPN